MPKVRLIDANALQNELRESELFTHSIGYSDTMQIIDDAPTIDAEPVRRGHWIWFEPYGALLTHCRKCSECGEIKAQEATNFCPNCGAEMDMNGGEKNATD